MDEVLKRFKERVERDKRKGRWRRKPNLNNAHTRACLENMRLAGVPHPDCPADHGEQEKEPPEPDA